MPGVRVCCQLVLMLLWLLCSGMCSVLPLPLLHRSPYSLHCVVAVSVPPSRRRTQLFVYGTLQAGFHWHSKFMASAELVCRCVTTAPAALVVGESGVPYVLDAETVAAASAGALLRAVGVPLLRVCLCLLLRVCVCAALSLCALPVAMGGLTLHLWCSYGAVGVAAAAAVATRCPTCRLFDVGRCVFVSGTGGLSSRPAGVSSETDGTADDTEYPVPQCVFGELYSVDEETLENLDEYEGVTKGYYKRSAVEVRCRAVVPCAGACEACVRRCV